MQDFLSGCFGGMLGTLALYPLDTVRVRKQTSITKSNNLYSGLITPLIGIGLEKSVVFSTYAKSKQYIDSDFVSGILSGLAASIVVTPVEKWKIIKQNKPDLRYRDIIPYTLRKGPGHLYNGLSACMMREVPGYAIYFKTYYALDKYKPLKYVNITNEYGTSFIYGGLSGMTVWSILYPIDTIKTNMQYYNTSFISATRELVKTRKLYNGVGLGVLRASLFHSFVFAGYTFSYRMFERYQETYNYDRENICVLIDENNERV